MMKMSPYAHKLSCNVVNPTPGLDKTVCNCGVHADWCLSHKYPDWADLDLFCNCGLTYHHKDCAVMQETSTDMWTHTKCTCGFSPEPTVTWDYYVEDELSAKDAAQLKALYLNPVTEWSYSDGAMSVKPSPTQLASHYTYCPSYLDRQAKCTCDTQGHQPGCVHLIDPYMACNCDYLYDDTMDEKYAAELYSEDADEFLAELDTDASEGQYYKDWMEAQTEWQGSAYNFAEDDTEWPHKLVEPGAVPEQTFGYTIKIELDSPTENDYDDAIIWLVNKRRKQ